MTIQKTSQAACFSISCEGPAMPPNMALEKPTPQNGLAAAKPSRAPLAPLPKRIVPTGMAPIRTTT